MSGRLGGTTSHFPVLILLKFLQLGNINVCAQVRLDPEEEEALAAASLFRVILFS